MGAFPDWIVPMAATLTQERFTGPDWMFEQKFDGIRLLAYKRGGEVELFSRNRLPQHLPAIARAVAALPARDLILDGEITWPGGELAYHVFDIMWFDGRSVMALPIEERRALLSNLLTYVAQPFRAAGQTDVAQPFRAAGQTDVAQPFRAAEQTDVAQPFRAAGQTDVAQPFRAANARDGGIHAVLRQVPLLDDPNPWERAAREGWEGVIAKRRGSPYEQRRSPLWLKMKCEASQELVVGGFTDPQGSRVGLGALLVGYFEGDDFVFAGKIGTGFDTKLLVGLRAQLNALEIPASPFTKAVGLPRLRAHWVRPEIVVQVAFIEWTVHGKLRHPRFLGVRGDKAARDVVKET